MSSYPMCAGSELIPRPEVPEEYMRRPDGYRGVNDAWMCASCGHVVVGSSDALMEKHGTGNCTVRYAVALVKRTHL